MGGWTNDAENLIGGLSRAGFVNRAHGWVLVDVCMCVCVYVTGGKGLAWHDRRIGGAGIRYQVGYDYENR